MFRGRVGIGTLMVLGSAAAFGTVPILAKLAYASGLTAGQTLAFRFALGALGLLGMAAALRQDPRQLGVRRVLELVGLGMFGYASSAGTFFVALLSLPASLAELISYIYPSLVALGAWLVFRRTITVRHGVALLASFAGLALLVGGVQIRAAVLPLLLAITTPILYAGYILAGERLMRSTPAVLASSLIHVGAAVTFFVALALGGGFGLPPTGRAWAVLLLLAILPSMVGISLFLAGLRRVGATEAAIMSTFEPIVTVVLAISLLGDRLSEVELVGAVAVIGAVVIAQWHGPETVVPIQPK